MAEAVFRKMPRGLREFILNNCALSAESFQVIEPTEMPEPQRSLLCHQNDMTSTLSGFHGDTLQVEALQKRKIDDIYLREVHLRTTDRQKIVEYGVIAIFLRSFVPEQQKLIAQDREPLGGLLHRFKIDFTSAPLCFFHLTQEPRLYGRFNELAKPNGQPLAWIMEILPN